MKIRSDSRPDQAEKLSKRFVDQIALVVGGAQGIGQAIAVRLAREGARVVIADIDRRMMASTAQEIEAQGGQVKTVTCDVRRQHQVKRMVAQVIEWYHRIDVLMHIAGVCKGVPFTKTDERVWNWTVDTNLKGAFLVSRSVAPQMIKQRSGCMVFMASTNSWEGEVLQAPYNASKAGLFLLAKTLARELGPYGIRSNALGPGFIRTRLSEPFLKNPKFVAKYIGDGHHHLIPLGRFGLPEDVAGPAAFLASRDADFVNGVLLFVDGGQLA
jgi:NAD(P)-dependent dehydrogenase (short-subunit alcohol dehydrogenase family)